MTHSDRKRRGSSKAVERCSVGECFVLAGSCLLLILSLPTVAFAYVDPSVMTYTIQALAGVAVALSTVIGVVWRRARKKVYKTLHIDENAGKVVEEDVQQLHGTSEERAQTIRRARERAQEDKTFLRTGKEHMRWISRFLIALLVCFLVAFTIGIVAPYDIVVNSVNSLQFSINNIVWPMWIFAIVATLVCALIVSAIRGRAFNVVIGVLLSIGLLSYLQATFMNTGLPVADGTPVPWDDFSTITAATGAIWILVIGFSILLAVRNSSALRTSAVIISIVVVLVQAVGLGTTLSDTSVKFSGTNILEAKPFATTEGINEVSSKDNIVLFVLDTFDNKILDGVLEEYPDALDGFTGFTHYPDTSGLMIPTRYSMACMITGRHLERDDPAFSTALLNEWWTEYNLLDALGDQGYSVDLYTGDTQNGLGPLARKADNFTSLDFIVPADVAVKELWRCALYRDMPWALKPLFWFYTEELNTKVMASALDGEAPYLYDDVAYYGRLKDEGLSIDDDRAGENGSFKLIHLIGSHSPITMNENVERVEEEQTNQSLQSLGSLRIVEEYLNQLKATGQYDNTTVIVTADHGWWGLVEEIEAVTSPIMLVKPAKQGSDKDEPLKISNAPISHLDLPSTILALAGGDPSLFGSGIPIMEVPNGDRTRYYDATSILFKDGRVIYDSIHEWSIDGIVTEWDSWSRTDQEWPIVE